MDSNPVKIKVMKPPTKLSFNQLKPKKTNSTDSDPDKRNPALESLPLPVKKFKVEIKKQAPHSEQGDRKGLVKIVGPKPVAAQATQAQVTNIINNNNINNYFIQPVGGPTAPLNPIPPKSLLTSQVTSPAAKIKTTLKSKRGGSARPPKDAPVAPLPTSTTYTMKRRESPAVKSAPK